MAVDDVHARIIKAMQAAIIDLDLPEIEDSVYFQIVPDDATGFDLALGDTAIEFPCVLLTCEGELEEKPPNADTGTKSYDYPVRVWIADKREGRGHERGFDYLTWRKRVTDLFDDAGLEAVPEVCRGVVVPNVIFDPKLPNYQHIVSGMLVRWETAEVRT